MGELHSPGERALRLHQFYRGKVQSALKVPLHDFGDFAVWYTPGVAEPCRAIQARKELVYDYTNKGNSIAIVSDGTRVLGLGDIGPEAGLPVMEGKALLFKYLGGVDATPLCLNTKDPDELIRAVEILQPSFGGINLEDICQPKCFYVLDVLRQRLSIPVWHDDQQGTAVVVLAGLLNALELVGKKLDRVRIALVGVGAANVATYRLLTAAGANRAAIIACDSKQTLHRGRDDLQRQQKVFADKWRICQESNSEGAVGGIAEALRGADVCLAFSTPGPRVIQPEWIASMARDAIVFACANPTPEIPPQIALQAGARIVATGRSDYPNQVNNSLAFPGVFRGVLNVRAKKITDGMAMAAAEELAALGREHGLRDDQILPRLDDLEAAVRVAVATGMKAQESGIAQAPCTAEELATAARDSIQRARQGSEALVHAGVIPSAPVGE